MENKAELCYYLNNVVSSPLNDEQIDEIINWVEKYSVLLLGRNVSGEWGPKYFSRRARPVEEENGLLPRSLETVKGWLSEVECAEPVSETAQAILDAFHLPEEYKPLVTFWCMCVTNPPLDELAFGGRFSSRSSLVPTMLDIPKDQYDRFFLLGSPLWRKGLLGAHRRSPDEEYPSRMIADIVRAERKTAQEVRDFVLGEPMQPKLKRADFEHVEGYGTYSGILEAAIRQNTTGVNLLLYGAAGTGKTEMTKTVCGDLGVKLYGISNRGRERSSAERRSELSQAMALMEGVENAALLVDECEDLWEDGGWSPRAGLSRMFDEEDLFGTPPQGSKSKIFFHQLLESAPIPILWVANRTHGVDPAHLRRFRFAVCMKPLSSETQIRIWKEIAEPLRLSLTEEEYERFANLYADRITPALMESAMKNAAAVGNNAVIEETLDSLLDAMRMTPKKEEEEKSEAVPFSGELLSTSEDLIRFADAVVSKGKKRFSLLLSGVSGSGKSAYARYLAERLGMPFLCKKASDLLDKYVGETEKNIAKAFKEAKEKGALLCFDECDSWLRDRRMAQRSWEVQSVNEMLTQMESHDGPFVCTTNLHEDIDQAAFRRFLRKVRYDYLTPSQVSKAFSFFFGMEIPGGTSDLTCLAPGDFVNVRKTMELLEITDPKELADLLRKEQENKGETGSRMGFAC